MMLVVRVWVFGIAEVEDILSDRLPVLLSKKRQFEFDGGGAGKTQLSPSSILGRLFTFEHSILKEHKLIKTGPYGIVRHLAYFAALGVYVGMFCWFCSRGSWMRESGVLATVPGKVVVYGIAALISSAMVMGLSRMQLGDELLKKEFGDERTEWAQRVRYKWILGVY
ncbi:hypothetical protein BDQ12DRAFT_693053 [Crucibulum laeve]|uniref:Uncharacterized protein n=1 Tax=Crucibulum laeve TaxID=68775 RepID=A0A5C3LGY2_9AGAR|nr:hypothetical protein BDQ12DRAFT_693053 [Crucibulum laeve]